SSHFLRVRRVQTMPTTLERSCTGLRPSKTSLCTKSSCIEQTASEYPRNELRPTPSEILELLDLLQLQSSQPIRLWIRKKRLSARMPSLSTIQWTAQNLCRS